MKIGILGTGKSAIEFIAGPDLKCEIKDKITTPPTLVSEATNTRAWRLDAEGMRTKNAPDASIDLWIVEAPWAHPAWHSYAISLIHLRPIDGLAAPHIYKDGATHEIIVYAMDPDQPRQQLIENFSAKSCMSPPNYASQFIEIEDRYARDRVEATMQQIVNGTLSPDTDDVANWKALFGDCMFKRF